MSVEKSFFRFVFFVVVVVHFFSFIFFVCFIVLIVLILFFFFVFFLLYSFFFFWFLVHRHTKIILFCFQRIHFHRVHKEVLIQKHTAHIVLYLGHPKISITSNSEQLINHTIKRKIPAGAKQRFNQLSR